MKYFDLNFGLCYRDLSVTFSASIVPWTKSLFARRISSGSLEKIEIGFSLFGLQFQILIKRKNGEAAS